MNFKFGLHKCIFAVLFISSSILPTNTLAKDGYSGSDDFFSPARKAFNSISYEKDRGNFHNEARSPEDEKSEDLQANFPFDEKNSPLDAQHVVGLRFVGEKCFYLGVDSTFYKERFDDIEFSKVNFFQKYPKLISIELNSLELTNHSLENLQSFMPKQIFSLLIHNCYINEAGYELLADILKKHNKLANIALRLPYISETAATLLLETIAGNCEKNYNKSKEQIVRLNLPRLKPASGVINFDMMFNVLSPKGCESLSKILELSAPTLNTLYLSWDIIEDPTLDLSLIKEESSSDLSEDELKSSNKDTAEAYHKIAATLEKLTHLKKLELSIRYLPEGDVDIIFHALKKLKNLQELRLYFENIHHFSTVKLFKHVEALSDSLKQLTDLKQIDISAMNLPSNAMQVLFNGLKHIENLEVLNISQNQLDNESIQMLCENLKNMKNLKTFIANECEINRENFMPLANALGTSHVTHVFLRGNSLQSAISNINITKDLQVLDLGDNELTFDDALALTMKTAGTHIQIINFKDNPLVENCSSNPADIAYRDAKRQELSKWKLINRSTTALFGLQ